MAISFNIVNSKYKPAALRPENRNKLVLSRETLKVEREAAKIKAGVKLSDHIRWGNRTITNAGDHVVTTEFIGTDDFASAWYQRQRFNIDVGRDEEPTLYEPLYNIERDPELPEILEIYSLGPAGVIFEEITEGGEVKFATMAESSKTARIRHYGVGVEYTKDMEIFNKLWRIPLVERQAGIAHNALLNHVHLYPFISQTYAAANKTAASAVGATLEEKFAKTLENALTHAKDGKRRGPYYLLCASANRYMLERVLQPVAQQGFTLQSSALGEIQGLIVYDGWEGSRGMKEIAYAGVTSGKGYLISVSHKMEDHQGFVKQDLEVEVGNADASRFVRAQNIWDTYFGMYCAPTASVEEITWPS